MVNVDRESQTRLHVGRPAWAARRLYSEHRSAVVIRRENRTAPHESLTLLLVVTAVTAVLPRR